jgi:hypothetical protein
VLSGWQTVAITLGASGITAFVALFVAWLRRGQEQEQLDRRLDHERGLQTEQLAHERTERWREILTREAGDFSTGIEQAILGIRDALGEVFDEGAPGDATLNEAKRRTDEAIARVARIKLLFGEDSETVRVAKDLLPELYAARGLAERGDSSGANEKLKKIYALHRDFNEAAFEMISSPKWRVSSSLHVPYRIESGGDANDAK